ncbi:hypothetical protein R84B8_00420 [Treponema sp. R8-4-B8]
MKTRKLMTLAAIIAILGVIGGLTACKEPDSTVKVASVTLNETALTMTVGDEITLTATVAPSNATNQNVEWSSSAPSVVSVLNGKVKAQTAGSGNITVKTQDGGKTATCTVTVNNPQPNTVTTPTATPASGEVSNNTAITLATTTAGAAIYYTQDGTEPSTASALYSDSAKPVITAGKLTLKAVAVKEGMTNSAVMTETYTLTPPQTAATPTATPASGVVANDTAITLASATAGAAIYYTQNGTEPSTASTLYSDSAKPVITAGKLTLKAVAVKEGMTNSAVMTATYTIKTYIVTFNADNGTANTTQTVVEGGTVNKPTDPIKIYSPIGLYAGTPPTTCTFVEWQKIDNSAWNFTTDIVTANVTLKAKWITPTSIDLTNETGNNIVEKAVSYVNTNSGSEYTLVIGEDLSSVAPQTLNQDDTTLTITSDGNTERKITLGSNGALFSVGGEDASNARSSKLIINGFITLEGKMDNDNPLIRVLFGGSLDLEGNSKLTGNGIRGCMYASGDSSGASVTITIKDNAEISGNSSTGNVRSGGIWMLNYVTLTMSGNASIKNNTSGNTGGGVSIVGNVGSVFIMNGGEISNNSAGNYGGGVYINIGGTFSVLNEQVKANIHSNTAPNGPNVYKSDDGTFTVGGVTADSF